MITWHIHTDEYGKTYTFDTWWLTQDGLTISPRCPSEHMDTSDVDYYAKGERVERIVRTRTEHNGEFQLHGRAHCGHAHHFIAVSCQCKNHEVIAA